MKCYSYDNTPVASTTGMSASLATPVTYMPATTTGPTSADGTDSAGTTTTESAGTTTTGSAGTTAGVATNELRNACNAWPA
mmetsp:Transcript_51619/g.85614  ORF Transcript_51619/g.85614 Transcript_51619/m.85614 type:complete len:81 (-) Transcript_51619:490-732(-)